MCSKNRVIATIITNEGANTTTQMVAHIAHTNAKTTANV
tara:strand:+ start:261 stop:377 length:117 start_codon:yes stop_codon:yes gene_type:complete